MSHTAPPLLFLRKFLQHGRRVASIAPSSRQLAAELCRHIDPRRPQVILELGGGTGAVTTIALQQMHPHSTLLTVEIDPDFAAILRQRCPQAQVLEADATVTCEQLSRLGISNVDVIISGLPIPSLPATVNQRILACVRSLLGNGYFSQLTVLPWVYLRFYRCLFDQVAFTPVWQNLPCGGVYHCQGVRAEFANYLPG